MPVVALTLFALLAFLRADDAADPIAVFKTGDYYHAIPALQEAVAKTPKDAALQAALLSALVYQGRVNEAADAAVFDVQNFPDSPEVLAARGDFAFYMGDMPAAENLYKSALKLKDDTARACFGLSRLNQIACNHRTARLLCLRAHEIDPDDAVITRTFIGYLVPEKRQAMLPGFKQTHPWLYTDHMQEAQETGSEMKKELGGRPAFELEGPRQETTLPLIDLHDGPRVRGLGLRVSIGGKPLNVLLDTGATGLLLSQKAIDKAGLEHVGSFDVHGIGDKGARNAFLAVAESCAIANLVFKNCVVAGAESKKNVSDEYDGLLSTSLFADYLITIDFQRHTLHLLPMPERPPNPQGYNREPMPSEAGFTPAFRFGGHMYVTTTVNGRVTGLFLLDTGAGINNVDSTFARQATKIHGEDYLRIHGVSGNVNSVFEADKGELQFARFRQNNIGLIAFDLNNSSEHTDIRMDGILGLPLLSMFRLSLDYRNALVNFDYVFDRRK